jgi:hypothetical protein
MKTTLILSLFLFSGALWAQQAPQGAQITNVTMTGSGCRDASAAVTLSPDSRQLSVLFDNFILNADASNVNPRTLRSETSCTVNLDVAIPPGWRMAFGAVDYRGFAALPANTVGYQRFLYQVPQMPIASMRDATFQGPVNSNYSFLAQQKPGREVWTPCGMTNFRLPLTAVLGVYYPQRGNYPQAQMALDSQDLNMAENFQVLWARCQ